MNGGAWDYVMGNYNNEVGQSGFAENWNTQYKDYINFYTSSAVKSHALSETANWYGDSSIMVTSSYPWMVRGGGYNAASYAGVFCLSDTTVAGTTSTGISFRVVLTLK